MKLGSKERDLESAKELSDESNQENCRKKLIHKDAAFRKKKVAKPNDKLFRRGNTQSVL